MAIKEEASDSDSDIDTSPKKKAKLGGAQMPARKKWTVDDARLIKKLREEDDLNWKS